MSIATPLRTQIEAIKARIDALAATATAEDIVMLSKAVEAIGGQASVFDVMAVAEEKAAEIEQTGAAIVAVGQQAQTQVQTAKDNAITDIKAAAANFINTGFSLPTLHAAALLF